MFHIRRPRDSKVIEVERVKTFSDSIFAFAMTLLITRVTLPEIPSGQVEAQLPGVLAHQWRDFTMYAISFISIGGYWVLHHAIFDNIRFADKGMLWVNMLVLLTVVFLPFPTALMAKYGRDHITAAIYGITMSLNYASLLLLSWYAYSDERYLKPEADFYHRRLLQLKLATPLIVALMGTALSFYYVRLSFLFYALVALANNLPLTRLAHRLHIDEQEMINPG